MTAAYQITNRNQINIDKNNVYDFFLIFFASAERKECHFIKS